MRALLQRIWELPWPPRSRRLAGRALTLRITRRLLVPHFMVGVVGLIENEAGEVLLLRHTYRSDYPWGLPTGFLEHGEQPAPALQREIAEETGMTVDIEPVWRVHVEPSAPIVDIVFRGTVRVSTFMPSAEISEARFYPPTKLPPLRPDQRDLVRSLYAAKEEPHETIP